MTTTDLNAALLAAFTAAGITTPEQVQSFVQIAALQVQNVSLQFQGQQLIAARTAANSSAQAAIEANQAAQVAMQAQIIALVASQSSSSSSSSSSSGS